MRLKKLAIFSVFILCYSFVGFGQDVIIPDPNTGDEGLDSKIEEVMSILNLQREYDLEDQTVAYFQKLTISNRFVFTQAEKVTTGKKRHPLGGRIVKPSDIAAYWRNLKGKSNFEYQVVKVTIRVISEDPNLSPFDIDKEADFVIKYKYQSNPADVEGEMSGTLYHMKRCTWD